MILRQIAQELAATANEFPVVTIIGPRQAGKTTLARMQFPNHAYANLEAPDIRMLAISDPHAFFSQFPPPVIIDEIQRVPELLSTIQVLADSNPQRGQIYTHRQSSTAPPRSRCPIPGRTHRPLAPATPVYIRTQSNRHHTHTRRIYLSGLYAPPLQRKSQSDSPVPKLLSNLYRARHQTNDQPQKSDRF